MTTIRIPVNRNSVCAREPLLKWYELTPAELSGDLWLCYSDEEVADSYRIRFKSTGSTISSGGKWIGFLMCAPVYFPLLELFGSTTFAMGIVWHWLEIGKAAR